MREEVLDSGGLEFVKSALYNGDYLAKCLAKLPFAGDRILTWVPDHVALSEIAFREGWPSQVGCAGDLWSPVIRLTHEFLQRSPRNIAIVESGGLPLNRQPQWLPRYFTFSQTRHKAEGTPLIGAYGYLAGHETSQEDVAALIDQAFPFHQILILTSFEESDGVEHGKSLPEPSLHALASRAQAVGVGAYDGEGVVVWFKSRFGVEAS